MCDARSESGSDESLNLWNLPSWFWGMLSVVVSFVPVVQGLSNSRLFYMHDLTDMFRPIHLWWRTGAADGSFPLWDPFLGFGQSAVANPLYHSFFPPVLLTRILLPETLGFNLALVLVYPVSAFGTYMFLRRRTLASSAALGAVVYAASGPLLSVGMYLNLAWAAAFIPWVLYGVDRLVAERSARSFALLAAFVGLQMLAAESLTFVATAFLAVSYGLVAADAGTSWKARIGIVTAVGVAFIAGVMLAAVQVVPTSEAYGRSFRAFTQDTGFASADLSPLFLLETFSPRLFGEFVPGGFGMPFPGVASGFLPSCYMGVAALVLATIGAVFHGNRRVSLLAVAVVVIGCVFACGNRAYIYPLVKQALPFLKALRWPIKFSLFAAFGIGWLSAFGFDVLVRGSSTTRHASRIGVLWASLLAGTSGLAALLVLSLPERAYGLFAGLLDRFSIVRDSDRAARFLVDTLPTAGMRLFVLALGVSLFIWLVWNHPRRARLACAALFAMAAVDLVVSNRSLNPTVDSSYFAEPAWVAYTREHPDDRFYVGGRAARLFPGPRDIDFTAYSSNTLVELSPEAANSVLEHTILTMPSGHGVREAISVDVPMAQPKLYWDTVLRFRRASAEERARFLSRTAVRYHIRESPPFLDSTLLTQIAHDPEAKLYETPDVRERAAIVGEAVVSNELPEEIVRQLFREDFDPSRTVILSDDPPPPAGTHGEGLPPRAVLQEDGYNALQIQAEVPAAGGYLLVTDFYDRDWRVRVDGVEAPLLRADGIFRAVHLSPGRHEIRMAYWPRSLTYGIAISICTALGLLAGSFWHAVSKRRRRSKP